MRFDVTVGLPVALRVLARRLRGGRFLRAVVALLLRAVRDPLRSVPPAGWPDAQETLTRHQLRPVLLMDDVAREVLELDEPARMALLGEVVAETGARFVATHVPEVDRATWHAEPADERLRFAEQLGARFFNMRMQVVGADDAGLAIDVTACRFVELCHAVGRPHLARLFCEADSRHFDREGSLITLRRTGTLAMGAPRCDFRFGFKDAP